MIRLKKIFHFLVAGLIMRMIILSLNKESNSQGELRTDEGFPRISNKENLPPFVIVVCKDGKGKLHDSFIRQLRQIRVLLKSAVSFTNEILRFIVLTNSQEVFDQVKSIPIAWPDKYRSRLQFESGDIKYPPERENMKGLLRPCSSARLFLPETLRDIDSAVYMDTDTIFLRPPEELLREIYKFNGSQAAGLGPSSTMYIHRKIPFPKPSGVNTGVMVMNMTRLRALPGGWTGVTLKAFDEYRKDLSALVTNDIINIALGQNPEIFYDLDCVWNYCTGSCIDGQNGCPKAEKTGVYLLHGTNAVFFQKKNPKFREVYEAWNNYQLGSPISHLLEDIKGRLKRQTEAARKYKLSCRTLPALDVMFTKSLETMIGK